MRDNDFAAFTSIMQGLADNFSAELSVPGLEMRFKALIAYPLAEIEAAALDILATRKFTKMPTVAEFVERMGGGSVDDRAEVEAGKVLRAIEDHGGYASVAFDDPVTQAVISQGFGGWTRLCDELVASEEKWFRKDFAKMYAAYARQRIEVYGHLPGRLELQAAVGQARYSAPVLIGDRVKARAIAAGVPHAIPADLCPVQRPN